MTEGAASIAGLAQAELEQIERRVLHDAEGGETGPPATGPQGTPGR